MGTESRGQRRVDVCGGVRVNAGRSGIILRNGTCQLAYGHFYFSVAVLTQAWFTSGFDYVRLGHVILLRLLSLVVLFGYPCVILCILACLQYNAGCAYSLFTHCQGHYKHRHGVCRCCIGIIYVPYIDYIGYLVAIRTMG